MWGRIEYGYTPRYLGPLSGVGITRPALPPGVLKQQRHLVTSRRYTSPALPENQPTGGCPQGYADWCLAREIVKTVKTDLPPIFGGSRGM